MGLGIVTDDEIRSDMENIAARIENMKERGRNGKKETPEIVREVISEEKINGTDAKQLAKLFNVSESSVAAYAHGATSTATYNDRNNHVGRKADQVKDKIISRANSKILMALRELTPSKISEAKARDIAGIAKDMSNVVKNLTPDDGGVKNQQNIQFVMFAPVVRAESDYDSLEVIDAE